MNLEKELEKMEKIMETVIKENCKEKTQEELIEEIFKLTKENIKLKAKNSALFNEIFLKGE